MGLFKTRLISLGVTILLIAVVLGVVAGSYALLTLMHPLAPVIFVTAVIAIILVIYVVVTVYSFIKWLFIEPFRKGRDK